MASPVTEPTGRTGAVTIRNDQQHFSETDLRQKDLPAHPVHSSMARIAEEFDCVPPDPPHATEASLVSVINDIVEPQTSAEACLAPTLALFGWAGEGRRIREALPHFDRISDIEGLRSVLNRLGYGTSCEAIKLSSIRSDFMPCLFSPDGIDALLIVERQTDGTLLAFAGDSAAWQSLQPSEQSGWAFPIWDQSVMEEPAEQSKSWLLSAISRFKPVIGATIALSFFGNLAGLTISIFVIFVYDLGIGARSNDTVAMLTVGAGIVITTNLVLRAIRARAMAYFGAQSTR